MSKQIHRRLDTSNPGRTEKCTSSKPSWFLPVNMGNLQYEGIAPFKNTTIELPLVGAYTEPNLKNIDQAVSKIGDFITKSNLLFNREGKIESISLARVAASIAAECLPQKDINSPEMEAFIWMNLGAWVFDDYIEKHATNKSCKELEEESEYIKKTNRNVWLGIYQSPKDIPKLFPHLAPALICFHRSASVARASLPNYAENVEYFIKFQEKYLIGADLSRRSDFSNNITVETYRLFRIYDVGIPGAIEFALLIMQISVEPRVRDHILSLVLYSLAALAGGIVNDFMSIAQDMNRENEVNYLKLLIRKENISLDEAVQMSINTCNDLIEDLELAGEELIKEFHEDPQVIALIEVITTVTNGCICYYLHNSRYGKNVVQKPVKK